MNLTQIESQLKKLVQQNPEKLSGAFIYELLLIYGQPKAAITMLKRGNRNLAKVPGEISWKNKVFFKEEHQNDLHLTISAIQKEIRHNQRFIIATNFQTLLAVDTKTDDRLDIELAALPGHYDFFLPWAGIEKAQHQNDNPADVRAAEKMAKLFDEIKKDNPDNSPAFLHSLNVFLSRLLFCFYAEDTGIFSEQQFTNALASHTQSDGCDLNLFFERLFKVLNTATAKRNNLPDYLNAFPFVNGGLFKENFAMPAFTRRSRQAILHSGEQNWSAINPDIFGSMFQAVIDKDQRGSLGQHYTSVPNIMKVIEPLFLNELYEEFEKAGDSEKKLKALLERIKKIRIFDPACGSGNFLIIAYKELRTLEMKILEKAKLLTLSSISLNQFYGIEIDDFAHEIAKLALWLAEHQMNIEFYKHFKQTHPTLPLKDAGQIAHGNACHIAWETVCPKDNNAEIFILGNPPYLGSSMQNKEQKNDLALVFKGFKNFKNLDYITCWFKKGADYIKGTNAKFAFVTTNSVCQGEQVGYFWPYVFEHNLEIGFAHTSFKWTNNARGNAGVTVAIVGVQNRKDSAKFLFNSIKQQQVSNINAYLLAAPNVIVTKRQKPMSQLPNMTYGNKPVDGGNLILNDTEKKELINANPLSTKFIKRFLGSEEFINGIIRYCIWIEDDQAHEASAIACLNERFQKVKYMRLNSPKKATQKLSIIPYAFGERRYGKKRPIVVPSVSSERREYIPIGFLGSDAVISNLAFAIYEAEPYLLGLLSSRMHMTWVRAVSGKLETRLRYSNTLSYNTFPFPEISAQRQQEITRCSFRILAEREKHSDKTMAELYDPDKMPDGLREAHRLNDLVVDRCYRSKEFASDEERLEHLFKLYERMVSEAASQESEDADSNADSENADE
ncbi:class I SAM-dependent DNA methyltransferase [Erysipelotrichia bacterium]